jgi:hypothetical protein
VSWRSSSRFIRLNPTNGAESFIRSVFGVPTEINGVKRQWDDVIADVGKRLAEITARDPNAGSALAGRFAEAVGLSDEDVQVLKRWELIREFMKKGAASGEAAGIGPGMTAAATKFEQLQRDFWNRIDNMSVGGEGKLLEAMVGPMEKLDTWLAANEPGIDANIGKITTAIGDLATNVDADMKKVDWPGLSKEMDGFSDAIAKLIGNLRPFIDLVLGLETKGQRDQRFKDWESDPGWFGSIMRGLDWFQGGKWGDVTPPPTLPPDASSPGGSLLGRAWGGVKRFFGGGGGAPASIRARGTAVAPPGPAGTYRPQYHLSDADLSDALVNKIAGEAKANDTASIDAVIDNMFNRLGTHTYGPSGNLAEVALAPGQYTGNRQACAAEAALIRSRIRAIASGGVSDTTGGSNEYRASWYHGPWGWNHPDARNVGGNVFAFNPKGGIGPYGPYPAPHEGGGAHAPTLPPQTFLVPHEDPNAAALGRAASIDTSKVVNFGGVTNSITINAPDPHSAAAMVGLHLDRNAHDLVSNLQGSVQ